MTPEQKKDSAMEMIAQNDESESFTSTACSFGEKGS